MAKAPLSSRCCVLLDGWEAWGILWRSYTLPGGSALARRKALIIDDEKAVHIFLKPILEREGFQVSSAFDAVQGPMIARQTQPEIMVLDIAMPGGGGQKVYDRLRMMAGTSAVPILIYSMLPKKEIIAQIPEAPDLAVLTKPSSPEEIVAVLRRLVGS